MSARKGIAWLVLSLGVAGFVASPCAHAALEAAPNFVAPTASVAPASPDEAQDLAFLTESSCSTLACVSDDQCSRVCGAEALCVLLVPGGNKRCLVIDY